jgi:hypothetical protein
MRRSNKHINLMRRSAEIDWRGAEVMRQPLERR